MEGKGIFTYELDYEAFERWVENFVKHHPYYKKRKRIGLIIFILLVVGFAIFYSNMGLNLGLNLGETFQVLFIPLIAVVSMVGLGYMRHDKVFAKKTKKVYFKKDIHKQFLGKKVTVSFNDEFITFNDKQYMWTEYSIVDTDDFYVFMYLKDSYQVSLFPKFPKDLPLEERNKLNQIIQSKFNVNIRL